MNMKRCKLPITPALLVSTSLLLTAGTALADSPSLKPGQWEHSFTLKSASGQIEAAIEQARQMMESLPPEQQAMVKSTMASQGISLDLKNYTSQVCLTQAQVDENDLPKPNNNCEQIVTEETADGYKVRYQCEGNPPVSGEGRYTILDEENYKIDITVNTEVNGKPEEMTINQTGKWLAAECT